MVPVVHGSQQSRDGFALSAVNVLLFVSQFADQMQQLSTRMGLVEDTVLSIAVAVKAPLPPGMRQAGGFKRQRTDGARGAESTHASFIPTMDQFGPDAGFLDVVMSVDMWAKSAGAQRGLPLDHTVTLASLRSKLTGLRSSFSDDAGGNKKIQAANKLLRLHVHWAKMAHACVEVAELQTLTLDCGKRGRPR